MAAYVRRKQVRDREYYQLVESRRVDGEPRQKVLVHLGSYPTLDTALREWPQEIERLRRNAQQDRNSVPKGSDSVPVYRNLLKHAASVEKRADDLEVNLQKVRELKKRGAV